MLRRVALVRTDVSEELSASIIRVTRIGELGAMLAVTSNPKSYLFAVFRMLFTANIAPSSSIPVTLMMEAIRSSETRFLQEPHGETSKNTTFFNKQDDSSNNNKYFGGIFA
jgi:hypothetical protein